jgi:hypothetical protein
LVLLEVLGLVVDVTPGNVMAGPGTAVVVVVEPDPPPENRLRPESLM